MTKFELAVKVIVDNIKEELENYKEWEIENWSDMLNAFGFDSNDMRQEIEYYLESYSDANERTNLYLTVDHELEIENGFITYRQLTNAVRKELFNK